MSNGREYITSLILERALNLLQTNFMSTANGCINLIQDSNKKYYKIPNFCINDPYFEKNINQHNKDSKNEKEMEVNV